MPNNEEIHVIQASSDTPEPIDLCRGCDESPDAVAECFRNTQALEDIDELDDNPNTRDFNKRTVDERKKCVMRLRTKFTKAIIGEGDGSVFNIKTHGK